MTASRAYLVPNVRGKKQVSKVHSISFDASSNESVRAFSQLSGTMDLTLYYDQAGMTLAKESQVQLYKYNVGTGTYAVVAATLDTANNRVTVRIKDAGHYVLMTNQ